MSFPRYPAYKDSDIPWVEVIPFSWNVLPLYAVAKECDEPNHGMQENNLLSLSYGRIVQKDINSNDGLLPESFETYQIVQPNDIVLRLTDLQNDQRSLRSALVEQTGIITSAYLAVRPQEVAPRFLSHLLRAYDATKVFYSMGGGLRQSMKFADLKRLPVVLPPMEEQPLIAKFLDHETAKIDSLVAEQERLIELLKEKRQAVISHAVTKGLNPSVPMKDSGVEWLGEVPAHWDVRRVKDVTRLESGHTPSKTVPEYWVDCDIPWVSLNDSKYLAANDYIGDTAVKISLLGIANSSARLLPADSVVFTRDATIGLAAITTCEMAVSQHLIAWCPIGNMNPLYLLRVFNAMKKHLDSYTFGATIKTIGMGDVKSLSTPVPPIKEQAAIAAYLEAKLTDLDELMNEAGLAVELLRERRTALISAAVTGQIDVRGLVPAEVAA
jgi:type I restriction enzyme, S subunit